MDTSSTPFRVARMVLIAIVAVGVGAVLAVPNFHGPHGCRGNNEVAAISTLRSIASAQRQFRAAVRVDEDGDGVGEFGTFLELSGALPLRGYSPLGAPSTESETSAINEIESPAASEFEPEQVPDSLAPC